MPAWKPEEDTGVPSYHSPLYFLETRSLSEPGGRLVPSKPQKSFCLCLPQNRKSRPRLILLYKCWAFKLRSSRLCSKYWPSIPSAQTTLDTLKE